MAGQNRSLEVCVLGNIRVSVTRDDRFPGVPFGGIYYPAGLDANGKPISSARWEGQIYINRGSYTDDQGNIKERKSDIVKIVLFNGRSNEGDGKGLADIAAKCLAPGKELSCLGNLHSYDGRVFIDGQSYNKANGEVAKTLKHSITVIPGTLNLGADADKQLEFEHQYYERAPQQFSFWSRPRDWQNKQSQGYAVWKEQSKMRMASSYRGGDVFGYAIVRASNQSVAPPMADANPMAQAISGMMAGQNGHTPAPYQAPAQTPAINTQGVQTGGAMPNLPGQVQQAVGGAPTTNVPMGTQNTAMPGTGMPVQQFNAGGGSTYNGQPF